MQILRSTISLVFAALLLNQACVGDEPKLSAADVQFFESKIRPALIKHCYECHSAESLEIGGKLLLDSRDGVLHGGEAGAVLVPGQPDASLLIQALRYDGLEMPPEQQLPEAVINDFAEWVKRGAPDPRVGESTASHAIAMDAAASDSEALWAFQPPTNSPLPDVKNEAWLRDPLDRFVLAKIETAGLTPNPDASPRTLVRRLYIDLTGLPPSFETVEEFVLAYDQNPAKASEELVDRLLASRQFGERWGRHLLDVARD